MELHIFKQYKEQTAKGMINTLKLSKYLNTPLAPFTQEAVITSISIYKDDSVAVVREKLEQLSDLLARANAKVITEAITKFEYCSTTYLGTLYSVSIPKFRDEVTEVMVQAQMREYVKLLLGVGEWDELHCRVLDLYKQGKITWAEVKEAHKGECSL